MSCDKVEIFGNSEIQHGKLNDRVYLMKLNKQDMPQILQMIESLVKENSYTKTFAKVPTSFGGKFKEFGFRQEANIPGFFHGDEDCLFMSKFFVDRNKSDHSTEIDSIIQLATSKSGVSRQPDPNFKYKIRKALPDDIKQICAVFARVFDSYPFPIFDSEYVLKTMNKHVDYYVAAEGENIVSVSSAEVDADEKNAEMTDFATLPTFRSQGIAQVLLKQMEHDMKQKGCRVVYTIARALSAGMNITFAKNSYKFGGTLVNNTNISGKIESMNVWYKMLSD